MPSLPIWLPAVVMKSTASMRSTEHRGRRELIGVGIAFGVTVAIISLAAGRGMLWASMSGLGGGLLYTVGWKVHQVSQKKQ